MKKGRSKNKNNKKDAEKREKSLKKNKNRKDQRSKNIKTKSLNFAVAKVLNKKMKVKLMKEMMKTEIFLSD